MADLDGLSFAPTSRVLRRSAREIQIERADNAVIVADLPEWVITHLRRPPDPPRPVHPTGANPTGVDPGSLHATGADPTAVPMGGFKDEIPSSQSARHNAGQERTDQEDVGQVLRSLTRAGYLVQRQPGAFGRNAAGRLAALQPDLGALDERFGRLAPGILDRRDRAGVRIHGTGRIAALVASLLAAAGVGEVSVPDSGTVTLDDVLPGGLRPADEGQRTALAAAESVRRARAGAAGPIRSESAGDLLISTDGYPVAPHLRAELIGDPRPHLVSGVWGSHAVIGPLVVPGHTSCLHCADLHRRDRDPAWPVLSSQLVRSGRPSGPSEVAVCTLAAAVTVLQALAFLDGERPATVDGTLEFRLPDWRLRRRNWARHAHCPCAG